MDKTLETVRERERERERESKSKKNQYIAENAKTKASKDSCNCWTVWRESNFNKIMLC